MAVPNSEAVQWLPSGSTSAESRSGRIGPIILGAKQTGERSARNPHAAFDEAGAGNVAWPRWCDTRNRKSEPTGNTKQNRRRCLVLISWGRRGTGQWGSADQHCEVAVLLQRLVGSGTG